MKGEFFAILKQVDRAQAAQDKPAWDTHFAALKVVQDKIAEINAFRGFSNAAEVLMKATDFEDFCAALPHVDLNKTYG